MARYLVSMSYRGKDYSVTITGSDENNAITFAIDDCVEVAHKATGHDILDIYDNIDRENFKAIEI